MTFDYVRPISQGGEHSASNGQLLCWGCNTARGTGPSDTLIRKRQGKVKRPGHRRQAALNLTGLWRHSIDRASRCYPGRTRVHLASPGSLNAWYDHG